MSLGAKKIETRSWGTSYRGWLAIQSSKGGLSQRDLRTQCSDPAFINALGWKYSLLPMSALCGGFPFGKIVAVVYLRACSRTQWLREPAGAEVIGADMMTEQEQEFGDYSDNRYGWVTDSLFRLPEPLPFKAKQGLVDVPAEVVEQIRQQWKGAPR